jgi:hypothetical protein
MAGKKQSQSREEKPHLSCEFTLRRTEKIATLMRLTEI